MIGIALVLPPGYLRMLFLLGMGVNESASKLTMVDDIST